MTHCQSGLHTVVLAAWLIVSVGGSSSAGQPRLTKAQEDAVALARKTASASVSIPGNQFRLVTISRAEWRDSSLGCPERGMAYTPALMAGYKVTLRESDRDVIVHVAGTRAVVCTTRTDPKLSATPIVESSLETGEAVRDAISRDLKVAKSSVRITSVRPARSGDPCAPQEPAGAGSIVEARVGAKTLRYYKDATTVKACAPN